MSAHNLDITSYTLEELFHLFTLPLEPTAQQMTNAKKKLASYHPDKSGLAPEYFIFYKKAYDIVLHYYEENNKDQTVPVSQEKYEPMNSVNLSIKQGIESVDKKKFHSNFNKLFDDNMVEQKEYRNSWFHEETPIYQIPTGKLSKSAMDDSFQKIRQTTQSLAMYKGVQEFQHSMGGNFLEDDDQETEYICSDPFSKLKYDDLRKVHKDQTIFTVGEKDFERVKTYGSVDEYQQQRITEKPMDKILGEKMLAEQERKKREQFQQRLHQSTLKTMGYEDKNRLIQSQFLQLT